MPPTGRLLPDDPREWLNHAASDLSLARSRIAGVYLEDLCFHAQQAAEKAIKALLIRHNVEFPYVHDLARLLDLLEEAGEEVPERVRTASALTLYAVLSRYPHLGRPVSETEYEQAVDIAGEVVRWAEERLTHRP